MFLVIFYNVGSAILLLPSMMASVAKQDAWISSIIITSIAVLLAVYYSVLNRLQKGNYFTFSQNTMGRWLGRLVIVITLIYFFILSVILLWDIGDFLVTHLLPETPIEVVNMIFILVVIYGTRKGIENLSRTAEFFMPWVFILFLIFFVFLLPQTNIDNIYPMIESGAKPIIHGGYKMLAFPFAETFIFLMITPYVNQQEKVKKSLIIGVAIGGLTLILTTLFCILVLGQDQTANSIFPVYMLGKKISIAGFLERLEVLIAIIWLFSIYFKLSIVFFVLNIGFCQLFHTKVNKPFSLPIGMLIFVMTPVMIPRGEYLLSFDTEAFIPITYIVCIVIPLIIHLTHFTKNRDRVH